MLSKIIAVSVFIFGSLSSIDFSSCKTLGEPVSASYTNRVRNLAKRTALPNADKIIILKKHNCQSAEAIGQNNIIVSNEGIDNFTLLHEIGHLYYRHCDTTLNRFRQHTSIIIRVLYWLFLGSLSSMLYFNNSYYGLFSVLSGLLLNIFYDRHQISKEEQADDFAIQYATTSELRDGLAVMSNPCIDKHDTSHPPPSSRFEKIKKVLSIHDDRSVFIQRGTIRTYYDKNSCIVSLLEKQDRFLKYHGFVINDDERGNVEAISILSFYYTLSNASTLTDEELIKLIITQPKCIQSQIKDNDNSNIKMLDNYIKTVNGYHILSFKSMTELDLLCSKYSSL